MYANDDLGFGAFIIGLVVSSSLWSSGVECSAEVATTSVSASRGEAACPLRSRTTVALIGSPLSEFEEESSLCVSIVRRTPDAKESGL